MRTKKGSARTISKKRLFKRAKGYRGGRETLLRSGAYAFRDRRVRKREFRRLWITRISAACQLRGINYSQFMHGLKLAKIDLNRKSLAEIAVSDPAAFDAVVKDAKDALAA